MANVTVSGSSKLLVNILYSWVYPLGTRLLEGMKRMGGIHSFFIESKLFQLVVEEGGNFFALRIFEQGKYFMKSVFMGKSAALWLKKNTKHTMIGVNPKQFFTLREGDTAYTLQRGSNSFGQNIIDEAMGEK